MITKKYCNNCIFCRCSYSDLNDTNKNLTMVKMLVNDFIIKMVSNHEPQRDIDFILEAMDLLENYQDFYLMEEML